MAPEGHQPHQGEDLSEQQFHVTFLEITSNSIVKQIQNLRAGVGFEKLKTYNAS